MSLLSLYAFLTWIGTTLSVPLISIYWGANTNKRSVGVTKSACWLREMQFHEVWGFRSCVAEDLSLLGCYTLSLGRIFHDFLCSVDHASPYILTSNPTRYTILFKYIYLSSLRVSGIQVPTIRRESLYLCDTGICHSGWVASGRLVGVKQQPADKMPPIQSEKYQCRIDTMIFSRWWALGCSKHVEKRDKYI